MRFRASSERGRLFMAHVQPFDSIGFADRIGKSVQGIARYPVNPLNARVHHGLDEYCGHLFRHLSPSRVMIRSALDHCRGVWNMNRKPAEERWRLLREFHVGLLLGSGNRRRVHITTEAPAAIWWLSSDLARLPRNYHSAALVLSSRRTMVRRAGLPGNYCFM
jgi:hypothetical protein